MLRDESLKIRNPRQAISNLKTNLHRLVKVQMSKSLPAPSPRQAGKCQMNAKMTQCQNIFFLNFNIWTLDFIGTLSSDIRYCLVSIQGLKAMLFSGLDGTMFYAEWATTF